jgi:hypothetical protein
MIREGLGLGLGLGYSLLAQSTLPTRMKGVSLSLLLLNWSKESGRSYSYGLFGNWYRIQRAFCMALTSYVDEDDFCHG